MIDQRSITWARITTDGQNLIWQRSLDFDHLLEREGYFNVIACHPDPEIIFISHTVFDHDEYSNTKDFVPYLFKAKKLVVDVNLLSSGMPPNRFIIPRGWPDLPHIVIHKYPQDINPLPQGWYQYFNDFCNDEYMYFWKQYPYRSVYYHVIGHEGYNIKTFELAKVHSQPRPKIFLSPSRLKPSDFLARQRLKQISENYDYNGYMSYTDYDQYNQNVSNDQNFLKGMLNDPLVIKYGYCPLTNRVVNRITQHPAESLDELLDSTQHDSVYCWSQANVIHKAYYETSYISIYSETVEQGCVYDSEKTLTPVLQGHFILPFGGCGIVEYLKHKGLAFPDFIDYTYSQEPDYQKRLDLWESEIHRLMTILPQDWHKLYCLNIDIHHYNRKMLFDKSYSKMGL